MWEHIQSACVSVAVVGAAIAYIYKAVKFAKAPKEDIYAKLQRDYDKINDHDKDIREIKATLEYLKESLILQIENDLVILEHMRTNNSTGKIAEREAKTKEFLLNHQQ